MSSELVTETNKAVDAIESFVAAYERLLDVNWSYASCGMLGEQPMKDALLRAAEEVREMGEAVRDRIDNIMPDYQGMRTINFTVFSDQPTPEFIEAIQGEGISVRGWEIPAYRFSKRKTMRNTQKMDRGWIDPLRGMSGNLKLTVTGDREGVYGTECDPQVIAFNTVVQIGERLGVYVANGGMVSE